MHEECPHLFWIENDATEQRAGLSLLEVLAPHSYVFAFNRWTVDLEGG